MRVRAWRTQDAEETNRWRAERGVPCLPESTLPKTSVVVDRVDGTAIAACSLYMTNSSMAYLAWPVTNPQAGIYEAKEALAMLMAELTALARQMGFRYIFTTVKPGARGLKKLLLQSGFEVTGEPHEMLTMEVK